MKSKIGALIADEGELEADLRFLKSVGYDYGEFGCDAPEDIVEEYRKNYKKYSLILPVSVLHLPPIDFKEGKQGEIKNLIREYSKVNCRNFNFHFSTFEKMEAGKAVASREKIAVVKELADFAKKQKANLILENTISMRVEELTEVFDKVKGLYFCLDTGHANLGSAKNRAISFLSAFGSRLKHVHAQDNLGGPERVESDLHLPIGSGNVDFPLIFKKLKELNYSGSITLEIRKFEEEARKTSLNRIQNLLLA